VMRARGQRPGVNPRSIEARTQAASMRAIDGLQRIPECQDLRTHVGRALYELIGAAEGHSLCSLKYLNDVQRSDSRLSRDNSQL